MVATWKNRKLSSNKVSIWNSEKENVSEISVENSNSSNLKTDVSVLTKTTSPKVIIQSDDIHSHTINQNICKHKLLKSVCLIVFCVIILVMFFLSIKTYNLVNELYFLLSN